MRQTLVAAVSAFVCLVVASCASGEDQRDAFADSCDGPCDASADGGPPVGDDGGVMMDGSPDDDEDAKPDPGGAKKRVLDVCGADNECSSAMCRPFSRGLAARCTKECTSSLECMSGTRCTQVGSESYCAASDIGRACSTGTQCNHACLVSQQYCTAPCSTGADCPNGYGCQPVGAPATKVCVKAAAACDPSDTSACIAPAACDTSASLIVASCTLACSSTEDCPVRALGLAPWACDPGGICRRPPDVFGPLPTGVRASYACNAGQAVVNVCNDGQHMDVGTFTIPAPPAVNCQALTTTDGAPGDTCVDSCRYRGGCTHGYTCTAVGSVGGGRIGLCLPAFGSGEVGAPCTTDAACFFGYCNRTTNQCSRDCTTDGLCPTGSTCTQGSAPQVEGQPFRRCE